MGLREGTHRPLGPFRASGHDAEIRRIRIPDRVVVRCRACRQDRVAVMTMTRRHALLLGAGALGAAAGPRCGRMAAAAEDVAETHGMSAFGDLKYPADFHHFDYVDINAPKGGMFSQAVTSRTYNGSFLTFNSLNTYILKGEGAIGMDATFATLMARAADEPDAMYGLATRAVRISPDKLTYQFQLRPEARFHDGTRIKAED